MRPVRVPQRQRHRHHRVRHGGRHGYGNGIDDLDRQFKHLNIDREEALRREFDQHLRNAFGEQRQSPDRRQGEIIVPGYEKVKSLKTGGMSDAVILVKSQRLAKLFIAKRVSASGSRHERAVAELRTLNCIRTNQNLNCMVEHFWDSSRSHLTMILEYCDAGSLQDVIQQYRKGGQRFEESLLWHAMLGIANALAYLHHGILDAASGSQPVLNWNTICHLDIKPLNVFLSNSGRTNSYPRIVLGDFGCAVSQSDILQGNANPYIQEAGTPGWEPPESEPHSREQRYGPSSDIWMVGATIHVLARCISTPDKYTLATYAPLGTSYGRTINHFVSNAAARHFSKRPDAQQLVREIVREMQRRGLGG